MDFEITYARLGRWPGFIAYQEAGILFKTIASLPRGAIVSLFGPHYARAVVIAGVAAAEIGGKVIVEGQFADQKALSMFRRALLLFQLSGIVESVGPDEMPKECNMVVWNARAGLNGSIPNFGIKPGGLLFSLGGIGTIGDDFVKRTEQGDCQVWQKDNIPLD